MNLPAGGFAILAIVFATTAARVNAQAASECPGVNPPRATTVVSGTAADGRGDVVAVGWVSGGPTGRRGAAWTIRNGRLSEKPNLLDAVDGNPDQAMLSVTGFGNSFVAVGVEDGHAAAWTSADGVTWTSFPGLERKTGVASVMRAVAYTDRLVAAGWVCDSPSEGRKATVWTSTGGNDDAWTMKPLRSVGVYEKRPEAQINSVTKYDGRVYAVGVRRAEPTNAHPRRVNWEAAVWRSRDSTGTEWDPVTGVDGAGGDGDQYMNSVTSVPHGRGLLAVGGDGFAQDTKAAVWTSQDGIQWRRFNDGVPPMSPFRRFGESSSMSTVGTIGDTIVAAGYIERLTHDRSPATWITTDPEHWTPPDTWPVHGEATSIMEVGTPTGMEIGWQVTPYPRGTPTAWSRPLALRSG